MMLSKKVGEKTYFFYFMQAYCRVFFMLTAEVLSVIC